MSVLANFGGRGAEMKFMPALNILSSIGKLKYLEKIVTESILKLHQINFVICTPWNTSR